MPEKIKTVLDRYISDIAGLYGSHLKHVLLYGSYARGDYREESDIDIMILVDLDDASIRSASTKLSDMTFDINYDNAVTIMPIVQNLDFFHRWTGAHPFYNNVNNEGIELYAAS